MSFKILARNMLGLTGDDVYAAIRKIAPDQGKYRVQYLSADLSPFLPIVTMTIDDEKKTISFDGF